MVTGTQDIVVIGGGVAGSSIAKVMAESGASVTVLESEREFRDRVRGEMTMPWGVTEAEDLGVLQTIMDNGGHELRWWIARDRRDLPATTDHGYPCVTFEHSHVQEALIGAAEQAGAQVYRGARVRNIETGGTPVVTASIDGHETKFKARLVVGADGRNSGTRRWVGFDSQVDPDHLQIAGVLLDNISAEYDAAYQWGNLSLGMTALLFPQGDGRARAYLCYQSSADYRLSGNSALDLFIEESHKSRVPTELYVDAIQVGPLASFNGANNWVDHPCKDGVVLIGDAAAASDPTYGQGLSMAFRDARVLRDKLLAHDNWDEAGHAYSEERDRYYDVIHKVELWFNQVLMTVGPEGDAVRAKAFPAWGKDPSRVLDTFFSGPDHSVDDEVRRRFFGED